MPENIRALIFILVMASLVFRFAEMPVTAVAMNGDVFKRRRNTWLLLSIAGFVSQNIWLFYLFATILVVNAGKKETNRIALFFFVIFALPHLRAYVPGLGGINYFIEINYQRLLVAILFFPMLRAAFPKEKSRSVPWCFSDVMIVAYFLLNVGLQFQYLIVTEWIRYLLVWTVDMLVPYFVISRCLRSISTIREVVMAYIVGAMVISVLGVFEYSKQWLMYQSLTESLGLEADFVYLIRGGNLRAVVTTGQAIVMGYVIAIAICLYPVVKSSIKDSRVYYLGLAVLLAGVISPLSKGPWVGVVVGVAVFNVLGPNAIPRLIKGMLVLSVLFAILFVTGYADVVIPYLPFVGKLDEGSMDYRQLVLEKSLTVIYNNPFFGSNDYVNYLEELRQGQGIIDIVNDYIAIALSCGLVGLSIFLSFFSGVFWRILKGRKNTKFAPEEDVLGRSIIGALIAILIMISSVSDISYVPIMFWGVAALGVAFSRLELQSKPNGMPA